jgi:formylglycine-generating enzyme required for sulfatase activity
VLFTPPPQQVPLDNHLQWWTYVRGADWRHPEGPGSSIRGRETHPVVHVAWEDAAAYARWAGSLLPGGAGREHSMPGATRCNLKAGGWPTPSRVAFQTGMPDRTASRASLP